MVCYFFGLLTLRLFIFVQQVIVNETNAIGTKEFITKRLNAIKSQRNTGELEDLALIIGSYILSYASFHDSFIY